MRLRRRVPALLLALAFWLPATGAGAAAPDEAPLGETVDRTTLRVCSDPAYLPFSNDQGQGFENRIAALLADQFELPLAYVWYPQTVGLVRNTLRARLCDLIMGVVTADELVQNSNPYYRSTYVLLHREGEEDRFGDLASPLARLARIGVVAGTPPADLLVRLGLTANQHPYQLMTDTRVAQPGPQMVEDLAEGRIDMALLWGPIAGYWAMRQEVPLRMVPLESDRRAGLRFDFRVSLGIRHGEPAWKHRLNDALRELGPQIDTILDEFGVPRLDNRGRLQGPWAEAALPSATVPEPDGYRMEAYRGPVPATLRGATVLDTSGLRRLIAEQQPLLVDVLPKPRRPPQRDPGQLWVEPVRQHLPGSVWLPNTGYGELSREFAGYFRRELERLTDGDRTKPLVFYCDPQCWMSWNAARRAIEELGYRNVYWYPEGAVGWRSAGLPLAEAHEVPMPEFLAKP
ncbi:quinoprotein dehydrogenase-associated putative ABC transporter substrate-binding protein [Marinimicrococcus flavescens]|uniref:Quinoprotein dehydrogenase-associated putative ABC transporter substrate-binding protein n=1 Tax=Marinimicrococcus flavescens TaxID=3031815 RepID=A0AAP3XPM1_9PROT|nr:quinoprotein dehydrogenase-associated putative ABC transporter substrate-binding protein [Marinimicrococcus flavescens]